MAINGWATNAGTRKRVFGKNLRIQEFTEEFIETVRAKFLEEGRTLEIGTRGVGAFCQGCAGCQYRANGCELMDLRKKVELSEAAQSTAKH